MNLTIKQLRAFVAVAETQSFSDAARRLHLTPGAVSLLVRDLETELGFPVFDRTTRRVALSRAGRDYLPAAEKVLLQVQAAIVHAHDVKNRATGLVRVAAPLILASVVLPRLIAQYRVTHPGVQVRPVDCTVEHLARSVEEDQADLAIGPGRATGAAVRRQALFPSPWVLWCHADHPLARQTVVAWTQLANEAVIAAGSDYPQRLADAPFGGPDAAPVDDIVPTYVVDNITTALGMTVAGLGVTLSPAYVELLARDMGLVMRPLGPPPLAREVCLYVPGQRALSPAAAALADFLFRALERPPAAALARPET